LKNSIPSIEPANGVPKTASEAVALAIRLLCHASIKIGIAGVVICYFGRFIATFARAFYLNQLIFRGWGWRLIAWCASFLSNQLKGNDCYVYGLCSLPLFLSVFLRLLGLHGIDVQADWKSGGSFFAKLPLGHPARRIGASLLILPIVPVIIGALAGVMILILGFVLFAIHASECCLRYGGIICLWMREVVWSGVRDALSRRSH
jgi:hypothetical protein